MKKTLNIDIDPAMMMTVAATLKHGELGRLFRALAARVSGEDTVQYLNNSGLRLAFALLSPPIDESLQRLAQNRTNGAKGGRPRKNPLPVAEETQGNESLTTEKRGFESVSAKKSKKEDLSPTPPLEEKIKKNNIITPSPCVQAHEELSKTDCGSGTVMLSNTILEWDALQEQMQHEQPWLDELCMTRRISRQDMTMYIMDFVAYLRERDLCETLPRAKVHFVNQLPYIIRRYKTNLNNEKNHENSQKFITDPVARRQFERESRRQEVYRAIAGLAAQSGQPAVNLF